MEKYKYKTKIGSEVNHIEINIHAPGEISRMTAYRVNGVIIKKRKIVYQTNYKIALNDQHITKLDRQLIKEKKETYKSYLNECSVSVVTKETYFPNGIFGTIYTTLNIDVAIKKLSQSMQKTIDKEYGWLSNTNISEFVEANK